MATEAELASVMKLLALGASDNENEARNSARAACMRIKTLGLVVIDPSSKPAPGMDRSTVTLQLAYNALKQKYDALVAANEAAATKATSRKPKKVRTVDPSTLFDVSDYPEPGEVEKYATYAGPCRTCSGFIDRGVRVYHNATARTMRHVNCHDRQRNATR